MREREGERVIVFKEDNGSTIDVEEFQESSNGGNFNATSSQPENEIPFEPIDNLLLLHRSSRVSMLPDFLWFSYYCRWGHVYQ